MSSLHHIANSHWLFIFHPWRREWQPTPVILPGESHGQRSLGGYSPQGRKALDTPEQPCSRSVFHMVLCMFPGYSVRLSHPLLPLLCSQVCSPCLHLHCCPANRFISTILETKIDLRKIHAMVILLKPSMWVWGMSSEAPVPLDQGESDAFPALYELFAYLLCAQSQSCPTLCNPIDRSPSDYSVHGIFQARILEWVAISVNWSLAYQPIPIFAV